MVCYFVDFENVMSEGLKGIEEITPYDKVLVLYSQMAHLLDINCVKKILAKPCNVDFVEVQNGTLNALDFRLVIFVTDSIFRNEADEYVIVSNDKGFDAAIPGWESLYGVEVKRCASIKSYLHPKEIPIQDKICETSVAFIPVPPDEPPKPPLTLEIIKKDVPRLCGFSPAAPHLEIILQAWKIAKPNKSFFIKELQAKNGVRTGMSKKKAEKMGPAYDEWLKKYS